jgi:hypothetical protein
LGLQERTWCPSHPTSWPTWPPTFHPLPLVPSQRALPALRPSTTTTAELRLSHRW